MKRTRTQDFEIKAARRTREFQMTPSGDLIIDNYDRADLAETPLAELVRLSGIMVGQKNPLDGFSNQIKSALREHDTDYRLKLERYERYLTIVGDGVTGRAGEFLEASRAELIATKESIAKILAEQFQSVFEFLIDNLDDARLETLGLRISQKRVATILYDHLNYYEDKYCLDKKVTAMVMDVAKRKAAKKGERIVKNMEIDEMDIKRIQEESARKPEDDLKKDYPEVELTTARTSYVSAFKNTLPPPIFSPDSQLPPSNPSPTLVSRSASEKLKDIDRFITGNTMPIGGITAMVPGSDEQAALSRAVQEMDNRSLRSSDAPALNDLGADVSTPVAEMAADEAPASSPSEGKAPITLRNSCPPEAVKPLVEVPPKATEEVSSIVNCSGTNLLQKIASIEATLPPSEPKLPTVPTTILLSDREGPAAHEMVRHTSGISTKTRPSTEPRPSSKRQPLAYFERPPVVLVMDDVKNKPVERAELKMDLPPQKPVRPDISFGKADRSDREAKTFIVEKKAAPTGWWGKAKAAVDEVKTSIWQKMRNVAKPLAVAAGIAVVGAAGASIYSSDSSTERKDESAENAKMPNAGNSASNVASSAPSTAISQMTPSPALDPLFIGPNAAPAGVESSDFTTPKFADAILHSTNPLVQRLVKEGKITMGNKSITDAMISPLRGLGTYAQQLQVIELEKQINLAIGVYFNEHFGTPAKVAESLKDPNLKNLYGTAMHAQVMGWWTPSVWLTREHCPQAAALGDRIFGDSHALGHDVSLSSDPKRQAAAQGNVLGAKEPGDTINMQKPNGRLHVVAEYMNGILNNQNVSDMMRADLAESFNKELADLNKRSVGQPATAPKANDKNVDQQKNIYPNAIGHYQDHGISDLNSVDAGWDELIERANTADRKAESKNISGLQSADSVEAGWDELIERADRMDADRAAFENTGAVEIELPLSMTARQRNEAVMPAVIEKIIAMHPQADAAKIKSTLNRFGHIAFKKIDHKGKTSTVIIAPGALKILKPDFKPGP